jgi:hypothetical protein
LSASFLTTTEAPSVVYATEATVVMLSPSNTLIDNNTAVVGALNLTSVNEDVNDARGGRMLILSNDTAVRAIRADVGDNTLALFVACK